MIRILSAIGAIALIIAGVMMMTQQGMFAQDLKFDKYADDLKYTNVNKNASISISGNPASIEVKSKYTSINRVSH